MRTAERSGWWASQLANVPLGAEPDLVADVAASESADALATHAHTVTLAASGEERGLILAAYAFVLGRATTHPEPDGKEMLIGLLHPPALAEPSHGPAGSTAKGAAAMNTLLLSPVRVLVDEASSLPSLRDACEKATAAAMAHALPLDELRVTLGRPAIPTDAEAAPHLLVRCTAILNAGEPRSALDAASDALFMRFGGACPDVQLRIHGATSKQTVHATVHVAAARYDRRLATSLATRLSLALRLAKGGVGTSSPSVALRPPAASLAAARAASAAAAIAGPLGSPPHLETRLPMRSLDLISAEERQAVLDEWTPSERHYEGMDVTFATLMQQRAAQHPGRVALEWSEVTPRGHSSGDGSAPMRLRQMTISEFDVAVRGLAARLASHGLRRGGFVALLLGRSAAQILCVHAALAAGAGFVPLDPTFPMRRIQFIMRDCKAALLLVDSANAAVAAEAVRENADALAFVVSDGGELSHASSDPALQGVLGACAPRESTASGERGDPASASASVAAGGGGGGGERGGGGGGGGDDHGAALKAAEEGEAPRRAPRVEHTMSEDEALEAPAWLIYTSGTTGEPKGVLMSQRAAAQRIAWSEHVYQLEGGRFLVKTSTCHSGCHSARARRNSYLAHLHVHLLHAACVVGVSMRVRPLLTPPPPPPYV